MKLNQEIFFYLTKDDFRVLTAIEMGMKNHELVPIQLIESIAGLKRSNAYKIIQNVLKYKLICHDAKKYDGYMLTNNGYDFLALKVLLKRGKIKGIGSKFGVGKESDIYQCSDDKDEATVLKLARLGRTSFRTIKLNRDYIKNRTSYNWLYLSRIAAQNEYEYMIALYKNGFPTPIPIDYNRHAVLMSLIKGKQLSQKNEFNNPQKLYSDLINLIIKLAEHGLIHGDFNEFNLLIDDDENVTLIDFPQMISIFHQNAEEQFNRDVECIQKFFLKKCGLDFTDRPYLNKVY